MSETLLVGSSTASEEAVSAPDKLATENLDVVEETSAYDVMLLQHTVY